MNIVHINATCGQGSTGRIAADIHHAAREAGHHSCIFWATSCAAPYRQEPGVIRIGSTWDHKIHAIMRRLCLNQGFNSRLATLALCKKLRGLAPDIVHLHNLHNNYIHLPILFRFLAKNKIATVVTLHDCWFLTGHCMHFVGHANCSQWRSGDCRNCPAVRPFWRRRVGELFRKKKELLSALPSLGIIGVSDWVTECARESICGQARIIRRIYNWVDRSVFHPCGDAAAVKAEYGIAPEKKMIFGASQGWSDEKGMAEFRYMAERLSGKAVIVLAGHPSGYTSTENIKFIGYTRSAHELAKLYSAADVFANPSRMETFGLVTAEALSCGVPVVAYRNTGMAELVSNQVGVSVPDGDKQAFCAAIESVLEAGKDVYRGECLRFAGANFDKDNLLREHLQLYGELCQQPS